MKIYLGNKNYSSWSMRPWLVLKHFDIPFTDEVIPLDQGDYKTEIKKRSPSGRVPTLHDGDLHVWDSLAIINYLAAKYPEKEIWPKNLADKANAFSISAEMHAGFTDLRQNCPMNIRRGLRIELSAGVLKDVERIQEIWTQTLKTSGGPYLFKNFSAADAMYAPVATRFVTYGIKTNDVCEKYIRQLYDTPAVQAWMDDGRAETWTIPQYDSLS